MLSVVTVDIKIVRCVAPGQLYDVGAAGDEAPVHCILAGGRPGGHPVLRALHQLRAPGIFGAAIDGKVHDDGGASQLQQRLYLILDDEEGRPGMGRAGAVWDGQGARYGFSCMPGIHYSLPCAHCNRQRPENTRQSLHGKKAVAVCVISETRQPFGCV